MYNTCIAIGCPVYLKNWTVRYSLYREKSKRVGYGAIPIFAIRSLGIDLNLIIR